MKAFNENFIHNNKKNFALAVIIIIGIVLLTAGLLVLFAFLTNDSNQLLFRILSIVIAILCGSSVIYMICENIRQSHKNIFFYNMIASANKNSCTGKIVGIGNIVTLQKGIKAAQYDLSTNGKTIRVYLNMEIQDYVFSLDEEGTFIIANNYIVEYEKE